MSEKQVRKRNFLVMTLEGTFFFTGLAFLDVNAVIPVFIYTFTHSLKLAGLATTVNLAASTVAQTLIGPYVKSIRNIPRYITWVMLLFRPLPFLMIPILFSQARPALVVLLFLVIYTLLFVGDGLIMVPWTDLFGRTILPEKRGKMLGYQQLFGGVGALTAGWIIKFLLENETLSDASRYAVIFSCGALALTMSALAMPFSRDLPHSVAARPARNWHYYARLPHYLRKNHDFRQVILLRALTGVTNMIGPFIILFGKRTLALDDAQVSTLVYIQIAGTLVGGLLWGGISSRFGNKYVILCAQITGLLIPMASLACFIVGRQFPFVILWPIVLINGANMGSWLGFLNYTIDIISEEERTIYLLLSSLIALPLTGLTFLSGIIAESVGFLPLFIISLGSAVTGILAARRLKSPRELFKSALEEAF